MTDQSLDAAGEVPAQTFPTSLKLDGRQERRLMEFVNTTLEDYCKAMGRGKDGRTETGSWLDLRRLNQLWYEGDLKWREGDEYLGGVFNDSNFTLGDGKRYVRHMAAKVTDDLIGTSPFFATLKKDNGKESPASALLKAVEDFAQDGVETSNLPETLREAVELALVRNEAVVKLRNIFETTAYLGPARVLVDTQGQPVLTPAKQLYVLENDDLLPLPKDEGRAERSETAGKPEGQARRRLATMKDEEIGADAGLGLGARQPGAEQSVSSSPSAQPPSSSSFILHPSAFSQLFALEKDASFVVTADQRARFQYVAFEELPQTQVRREGLDARILDPRDFICDLFVDDVHESVLCAHFYDESPTVLRGLYGGFEVSRGYFCAPESGEKSPIESQGEQRPGGQEQQWVHVGEVYVRFDADEDGQEEEILLVMDRDANGGTALFYDYLHKHMKRRPFEVLHGLRKVPSRWYGVGIYADKFDQLIFIDKTFNRINLKNSKTCTVTAVRRDAIEEWSVSDAPIEFGGDEVLTLTNKWSDEKGEFVRQVRLVDVSEEERDLMQAMRQAMDQEFGYISAADASAAGLNQSRTATGIASIERSGNNIVKAVERVHVCGMERILEQAIAILLENMDEQRLALTKHAELLSLNRDEIRDLPRDVRLLLTRSRSSELLAINQQALAIANEYFGILEGNPRRAKALRPMYLAQLKALEVQDADEILPEVSDEMVAGFESAKPPAPGGPRETITIPYKELLPSERAQVLERAGIKAEVAGVGQPGSGAGLTGLTSPTSPTGVAQAMAAELPAEEAPAHE